MKTAWYELHRDRFSEELEAFNVRGINVEIDKELQVQKIIRLFLTIDGNNPLFNFSDKSITYQFTVVYPDLYPWFRPEVFAYNLDLARHLHLRNNIICLLPRGTEHWDPNETVASVLESQLNVVLEKGIVTDEEIIKADETEQAEPVSDYYDTIFQAPVLFDPSQLHLGNIPDQFRFLGKIILGIPGYAEFPTRMAVLQTILKSGVVHNVPKEIEHLFSYKKFKGLLYEAAEPPPFVRQPIEIFNWLKNGLPAGEKNIDFPNENVKLSNGIIKNVTGIRFPQEVEKGKKGSGWIFIIECMAEPPDAQKKIGQSFKRMAYLARPAYISTDAIKDRIPRLSPLANKSVAIVGLGALGSFAAIELARSGIKQLKLLDFDIVDPPTTVRWPLGISSAGVIKTLALKKFLADNYPLTEVVSFSKRLGSIRIEGNEPTVFDPEADEDILHLLVNETDLLLDATAEPGVNNYLSRFCVRKNMPHVIMYATPGAWGGVVMRWEPDKTEGCWNCLKSWQYYDDELVPPVDDQGLVQPPGCADITFTGGSFDLQNISLGAVRMIVSTLCSGEEEGYPALPWDWAVLSMVDSDHNPISPTWKELKLKRHPKCNYCAKKTGNSKNH